MLHIFVFDQIAESVIASYKQSAADALLGPRNYARLRRRTVAAPWARRGDHNARSAHPGTQITIMSSVWTKDFP